MNNQLGSSETNANRDFIRDIVVEDRREGRTEEIHTRFPPEPNGFLHIGHAKSICLNFGVAEESGGVCNLRFDDTNPTKEEQLYVDAIRRDVRWLGWDWGDREYFASDYFDRLYEWAVHLVKEGKAYVCDLSAGEIREYRGTLTTPGKESPFRGRSVEENLDLLDRMRQGEFADGEKTLRAKIDMSHPNLNMRDPVMYRILHASHHRTGDKWCIYPMYDFAHGQSDAVEGITHSICTLEFEDHRPLYEWFLENIGVPHKPKQLEFARLNMTYTILSKRKLRELVERGYVSGWDDPRMPTLAGLRRRGYTPEAIRAFCDKIGVSKTNSVVDVALLEECLRDDLNRRCERRMAVLRPLKLILDNYPQDREETFELVNNPEDPSAGTRKVPFSKVVYIERDDFMEDPPRKFFRLAPGREVRLRGAYLVTCTDVEKDASGEVTVLHCRMDPDSQGGDAPDGRRVKATLHWVSAQHAVRAEVRLYDRLFKSPAPDVFPEGADYKTNLNDNSLEVLQDCMLEPSLAGSKPGERWQFERLGYFCTDQDSVPHKPVFNRTITLKDTWAKIQARMNSGKGKK
ncbi:MAG: glutamine--tRNA ligase/YqeY domain fusion protein [Acidobacteriota bacterium]|jgi:glutaminyl-tRNA synthetase